DVWAGRSVLLFRCSGKSSWVLRRPRLGELGAGVMRYREVTRAQRALEGKGMSWCKQVVRRISNELIDATACVSQNITRHLGQTEYVVEFAISQQPSIGGHQGAAKLEHQAPLEIHANSTASRFTP